MLASLSSAKEAIFGTVSSLRRVPYPHDPSPLGNRWYRALHRRQQRRRRVLRDETNVRRDKIKKEDNKNKTKQKAWLRQTNRTNKQANTKVKKDKTLSRDKNVCLGKQREKHPNKLVPRGFCFTRTKGRTTHVMRHASHGMVWSAKM